MQKHIQSCYNLNVHIFKEIPGGKNLIVTGAANRNIESKLSHTKTLH